jgi:cytochrome c biogenesis protein CcmG, thiol:disulfide interchange protein DsbE
LIFLKGDAAIPADFRDPCYTGPTMRLPAAIALATALAGCALPAAPVRAAAALQRPLVLSAPDLSGKPVDVGAQRGLVRVVDFWATWCEPCRKSMPALDRLAEELAPRGLAVYGVSLDEDPTLIPPFLLEVPVRFPLLWDRGGEQLAARFEVQRLPTTLIVDRRGTVRFVHEGWTDAQERQERRELEQLLAEP